MLRTTVSKLRHVCALAYFVPRLLRGNIRNIPGRFEKLSVSVQRRVDKSTDSSAKDDSDYERCQRIIDRAFSPNPPHTHFIPDPNAKHKQSLMNMVTPEVPTNPESQCEKCQRIIDKIFGEDSNAGDKKRDVVDPVCIPMTELQATTAKENDETLAQKVEVIDETPLVEAAAKPKIEGFNIHPKVLGSRKKRRTNERIPILNYSTDNDKPIHGRRRGTSRKDNSLDELAKRCLDTPSGQIDERLLKEMEKLGVPPSTRRGSRRTASDAGIVQPDIMRRPRRPVEKTDLDFLSRMRRLRELERLNDDLPPPFELIPFKANSVNLSSSCEPEDNSLYVERILPYYLTDQIRSQPESATNEEEFIGSSIPPKDERPPQQLLGQMTATVMSDESNMMTDKSNEIEHLIIRQERLNPLHLNDNSAAGSIADVSNIKPGDVLRNSIGEEISLSKLMEMEKENVAISREKLASTNLLSEMVDPNDISPQTEPSRFIKEYKEIETLRNLLQTRFEHLTNESVKARQFKEFTTEFSKDSLPFIDSETNDNQGFETLKMERIKPLHLKEDPNIVCKETSPHSEPGILIREISENVSLSTNETDSNNQFFRGYSPNQERLTPHQLFEQISLISRETELGTVDDYQEIDYSTPGKATPSQLLDNVGVVCKDNPPSMQNKLLPENNIQNIVTDQSDPNQVYLDPYDSNVTNNDYVYTHLKEQQDTDVELWHHTLLSSSELSRRALTEEETEEPVIAVEMGRIESAPTYEQSTDHNVLVSTISNEHNQEQLPNHNVLVSALNREPILKETDGSQTIAPETIINPLLDKGTFSHVTAENLNANIDNISNVIPKEHPQKPLTLSEMLKRVRERNRMELCKGFVELRMQNTQVDPVVGECGKKNPPCPPPAPTCPPPPKPPCPPEKPPCPNPCKPKCPPTCPPAPCGEPKPKCPPPKKSPCDKFQKTKCSCVNVQDALTLLLYLGPQLHIPQKSMLPLIACAINLNTSVQNSKTEAMERMIIKLQDLCSIVLIASFRGDVEALEAVVAGNNGTNYVKTYDPWSPIPSWPIPVKEEKRKLVCPKEGCKVVPPKLNAPCRDINPCVHLPRHNKFSVIDFIIRKLRKNIVCDD